MSVSSPARARGAEETRMDSAPGWGARALRSAPGGRFVRFRAYPSWIASAPQRLVEGVLPHRYIPRSHDDDDRSDPPDPPLGRGADVPGCRSEERRVGKECRSRWSREAERKKQ